MSFFSEKNNVKVNQLESSLAQKATKGQITSLDFKVNSDAEKIKLYNLADEVHQALTGNAPALSVIPEKSVTIEKVGFLNVSRRNLYNSVAAVSGYINSSTGALVASGSYKSSDYIAVVPNAQYYLNEDMNLAFYDANKVYISGLGGGWGDSQAVAEQNKLTVPNNNNIKYLRTTSPLVDSTFMVLEGGEKPSAFIPYGEYTVTVSDQKLTTTIKSLATQAIESDSYKYKKQSIDIETLKPFDIKRINIANPAEFEVEGTAVRASNGTTYSVAGYQASGFIPIKPNTNYVLKSNNDLAFFDANKVFVSGKGGGWTNPLTSPSNAAFMRVTFTLSEVNKMVVEGTTLPAEIIPYEQQDILFTTQLWENAFQKAFKSGTFNSPLNGLKWNALGDSITNGFAANGFPYHKWIADRTGVKVTNYGINGSTIASYNSGSQPMSVRYANMVDDADIITVFGGVNDNDTAAGIGTMADRTTGTLYGALHVLYQGLIQKYPGKRIGVITPLQRNYFNSSVKKIVDVELEVANYYSLPVLDLWRSGGLSGYDATVFPTLVPDGLHPNENGHKVLSRRIESFLLSL